MTGPVIEVAPSDGHDGHADLILRCEEGVVRMTARGVQVVAAYGPGLDVAYSGLRRIQLDIEQDRPATFVLVPHDPRNLPQVLSIPAAEYATAGQAIALIGSRLARLGGRPQG